MWALVVLFVPCAVLAIFIARRLQGIARHPLAIFVVARLTAVCNCKSRRHQQAIRRYDSLEAHPIAAEIELGFTSQNAQGDDEDTSVSPLQHGAVADIHISEASRDLPGYRGETTGGVAPLPTEAQHSDESATSL